MKQYLIFSLENRNYAIELLKIQEIQTLPSITKLPFSTENILGLINLRGEVIPVLHLKRIFQIGEKQMFKLIICVHMNDKRKISFVVDDIKGFEDLDENSFKPVSTSNLNSYTLGGIRLSNTDFVTVLDIEKLFSKENILTF